jgi:hypothetical protein
MAINMHATATIDVHAQQFQQFMQGFNQFERSLGRVPGQFQNIGRVSGMAAVQMQQATAAMMQNMNAAHTRLGSFGATLQKTSYQLRTGLIQPMQQFFSRMGSMAFGPAGGTGGGGGGGPTSFWGRTATGGGGGGGFAAGGPRGAGGGGGSGRGTFGAGAFYSRGPGMFGRRYLRPALSGLAGGGALWGIANLASGAADDRRFYQGLGGAAEGMDYATTKSYELAYGRFFDPKNYLRNIGSAKIDPTGAAANAIWGLGMDPQQTSQKELANKTLTKLREDTKGMDATAKGLYYEGRGISGLMGQEDFRRITDATDEEFKQMQDKQKKDEELLKLEDAALKTWTDLNTQLQTSATVLRTQFLTALEPLAPALAHLSSAVTNLSGALLNSPLFKKFMESTGKEINAIAGAGDALAQGDLWGYIKKLWKSGEGNRKQFWGEGGMKFWDAVSGMFSDRYEKTKGQGRWDQVKNDANSIMTTRGPLGRLGDWLYEKAQGAGTGLGGFVNNILSGIKVGSSGSPGQFDLGTPNLVESDKAILKTLMGMEAGPQGYGSLGDWVTDKKGNKDRAYGMYQVMGNNIKGWTKQFYGQELDSAAFLGNPRAQDAVALGQFKAYLAQYGNVPDALAAWNSGQPLSVSGGWKSGAGTVSDYAKRGVDIWNKQPGVTKVEIGITNNTGSGTSVNAATNSSPAGVVILDY